LATSALIGDSGQKLIKIGKKKSMNFNVTIKILSNNGHSSLVGLSSILIYGANGDLIPICENNLKQPKWIRLFTESN
jgi:hypothetical protein